MPERSKFTRYKPKITKSHSIGKTFFKNLTSGSKCCIIKKLYNKEYDGFVLCPFFFFCPQTRNSGATEAALKFNITILQSECSAVGSAPALGAVRTSSATVPDKPHKSLEYGHLRDLTTFTKRAVKSL